jgi:hypothetical protein
VPCTEFEQYFRVGWGMGVLPTNNGLTCIVAGWDAAQYARDGSNLESTYLKCLNSVPVQITFTLPAVQAPSQVIWTVSFNTSGYGQTPFGYATTCATSSAVPMRRSGVMR